jgi:hypothetical protein
MHVWRVRRLSRAVRRATPGVGADVQAVVRQTERMAVRPQDVAAVMHSVGGQLHSVGRHLHGVRGHVPSVGDLAARVGWGTLWVAR